MNHIDVDFLSDALAVQLRRPDRQALSVVRSGQDAWTPDRRGFGGGWDAERVCQEYDQVLGELRVSL
jgi:hypothetical protein